MPEIKNHFLQGKMNKDLDDRLIPIGQYRDAQNITISKSENSDVGTVQNVKGNAKLYGTSLGLGDTYETIGVFADSFTGDIFWFVTDFSADVDDNSSSVTYAGSSKNCRIYYANADSQAQPKLLIDSYRLNFNKNYKILHINKLDDLLFWTDNYNQPRRINWQTAVNQADDTNKYYKNDRYLEDKISVAQYAPYAAPIVSLAYDSSIKSKHIEEEFVKFGYRFKYDNNEYSLMSPFTQHCFQPGKASQTFNDGTYASGMAGILTATDKENVVKTTIVDSMVNKANKITLSITLPFDETISPHATAKVNDGSGLSTDEDHDIDTVVGTIAANNIVMTADNEVYVVEGGIDITSGAGDFDTTVAISPTIADNTDLYFFNVGVESPYSWENKLKIKEIEILYSESDSAAIKVIDRIKVTNSITVKPILEVVSSTSAKLRYVYDYVYKATKPTKTLPEADLIRVNDVIPVKAKTQEISGNRIIYGNYLQNREIDTINASKFTATSGDQGSQNEEYLLSSVKSNRTYQLGIVLSDKYGRQSPVIIPEESTTFVEPQATSTVVTNGASSWTHSCLRATFNETIGNDRYHADTNPLGWYSYRFVVKQTEQEYYNVYTPQLLQSGTPTNATDERSFIYLHGDNINKVPRDVTDLNVETGTQGSQTRLLPKVTDTNIALTSTNRFTALGQLDGTDFIDVTSIGTAREQSLTNDLDGGNATDVLEEVYNSEKNPLMGELPDGYGVAHATWKAAGNAFSFYVFETYPFVSVLDIYYETSSCGLLEDLNSHILESAGAAPTDISITSTTFTEANTSGTTVGALSAQNASGSNVSPGATFVINSVTDGLGASHSGAFAISGSNLNTNTTFEFKNTVADNYTVNITATRTGTTETHTKDITVSVQNVSPTIVVGSSPRSIAAVQENQATSITITGTNGSVKSGANTNNLTFSIVSQSNSGRYTINSTTGVISAGATLSNGMSDTLVLKTTDVASANSADTSLTINVTGSPYTQFYRASNGFSAAGTAVAEPTGIQVWHNGDNALPEVDDVVYSNAQGSSTFNSSSLFYSMCGPSFCSAGTAVYAFKTNSSGVVTHVSTG